MYYVFNILYTSSLPFFLSFPRQAPKVYRSLTKAFLHATLKRVIALRARLDFRRPVVSFLSEKRRLHARVANHDCDVNS